MEWRVNRHASVTKPFLAINLELERAFSYLKCIPSSKRHPQTESTVLTRITARNSPSTQNESAHNLLTHTCSKTQLFWRRRLLFKKIPYFTRNIPFPTANYSNMKNNPRKTQAGASPCDAGNSVRLKLFKFWLILTLGAHVCIENGLSLGTTFMRAEYHPPKVNLPKTGKS